MKVAAAFTVLLLAGCLPGCMSDHQGNPGPPPLEPASAPRLTLGHHRFNASLDATAWVAVSFNVTGASGPALALTFSDVPSGPSWVLIAQVDDVPGAAPTVRADVRYGDGAAALEGTTRLPLQPGQRSLTLLLAASGSVRMDADLSPGEGPDDVAIRPARGVAVVDDHGTSTAAAEGVGPYRVELRTASPAPGSEFFLALRTHPFGAGAYSASGAIVFADGASQPYEANAAGLQGGPPTGPSTAAYAGAAYGSACQPAGSASMDANVTGEGVSLVLVHVLLADTEAVTGCT